MCVPTWVQASETFLLELKELVVASDVDLKDLEPVESLMDDVQAHVMRSVEQLNHLRAQCDDLAHRLFEQRMRASRFEAECHTLRQQAAQSTTVPVHEATVTTIENSERQGNPDSPAELAVRWVPTLCKRVHPHPSHACHRPRKPASTS